MDQLDELVGFLGNPSKSIQKIALENVLPYSAKEPADSTLFTKNDFAGTKSLLNIVNSNDDDPAMQKMALSALINICENKKVRSFVVSDSTTLARFVGKVLKKDDQNSGLYCMLLANLAHDEKIVELVGPNLDLLVYAFLKNSGPMSPSDFLAFVFAEIARQKKGREYWTSNKAVNLAKLYTQLFSPVTTRRSGVAATFKNCLLDLKCHDKVLQTSLIETIMIALKGPEPLDAEDESKLPESVRKNISVHKKREPDQGQQIILVECLLLLSSTPAGREQLREKNAYFIIRELHLATGDDHVKELCERFVNMVMRGEPEESKIVELLSDDSDDDVIQEVV